MLHFFLSHHVGFLWALQFPPLFRQILVSVKKYTENEYDFNSVKIDS